MCGVSFEGCFIKNMSYWTWQLLKMSKNWLIARSNNSFFYKATLKTNPTHLLNFLKSSTKKNFMTKFGQIVAKYDPNLAKFGHTDLSGPWNSLSFIQDPSNSIKSTFLYANFLTINYGPSERRVPCFNEVTSSLRLLRYKISKLFWNALN